MRNIFKKLFLEAILRNHLKIINEIDSAMSKYFITSQITSIQLRILYTYNLTFFAHCKHNVMIIFFSRTT